MPTLMEIMMGVLEACVTVGLTFAISPKVRQSGPLRHIVFAIFLSVYLSLFSPNNFLLAIVYYILIVVLLNLIYNINSFNSAYTLVILYTMHTTAGLIAVNLFGVLKGQVFDFRTPFTYQSPLIIILYLMGLMAVVLFFRTIISNFKAQPTYTRGSEEILTISNFIMAFLFILYLKTHLLFLSSNLLKFNRLNNYLFAQLVIILSLIIVSFYLMNKFILKKISMEKFRYKAEVDPLTGALSRDAGMRHLRLSMRNAHNKSEELTIGYVDINNLKTVNDKFGHAEGDVMIKRIVEVIKDNLRDHDVVSRIGGDEFMVIFQKCNETQALKVWRRITDSFIKINLNEHLKYSIGASAGFTQYDSSKHRSLKTFMEEADEAMYQNKRKSKSR